MIAALFAAMALGAGGVALFGRAMAVRAGAYCVLVLGLVALWFGALGHARPMLPLIAPRSGTVLAFRLDEPHAIYLWVAVRGAAEPLALQLPWSTRKAGALEKAARAAKRGHGTVRMRGARGSGGSGIGHERPMFYPAPPTSLPDKDAR